MICVELLARKPGATLHRQYAIDLSRDLFDVWTVSTRWGRAGSSGRVQIRSFPSFKIAQRYTVQKLRQRATAPRRIGASYFVKSALGLAVQMNAPVLEVITEFLKSS